MADFSELSLKDRLQMSVYRWRRIDPVPWTPLRVPLAEARVGLVTSAGLYRPGVDAPFQHVRGGDYSFRVVPDDVGLAELTVGQTSQAFDRGPVEADHNMALPVERVHRLAQADEIGSVAPRHLSFNGSITAPGRLIRKSGPEAAEVFRQDEVDAALFVPI